MPHPLRMPALGQASDELRLVCWFKAEGDEVAEGEPLFEVESDKTNLEVEAVESGTLLRVLRHPAEVVAAGTVLGWLGQPGEEVPDVDRPTSAPMATAAAAEPGPAMPSAPAVPAGPTGAEGRRPATPAARALAKENGIDLGHIDGTGPEGRVERRDVMAAIGDRSASSAVTADQLEPVPAHRHAIARRLSRAVQVPQFSLSRTVDASWARQQVQETPGLGYTHLFLRAVSAALRQFPALDRLWVDDGPSYRRLGRGDVGLAIAAGDNLVVATIASPGNLSLDELARVTDRAVSTARSGKMAAEFLHPAAVTVSNLGMFGIDRFQAIVGPDQTAVLAVGAVQERPAVTPQGVRAVAQLDLTLTVDHRVADGAEAAKFLSAVCADLEMAGAL